MVGTQGDVPLVGRAPELDALRTALDAAVGGSPGGVLVAGPAGGGKSRLVRELVERAPAGTTVLRAQCVDLGEPGLPHLTMVDLVRAVRRLAGSDPALAGLIDGLPALRRLTDPDNGATGTPADDAAGVRLYDATATLLAGVGGLRGPVVVVVEDLQWADASSAGFLLFLVSRLTSEPLLVVATARSDGVAGRPRLRRLLADLARLPNLTRLDLAPFDADEVATYLSRAGVADERAADITAQSGGNPYFVEVLASAGEHGSGALADLLLARVDALPAAARTLLRAAAVAGSSVPDRQLRAVAGTDDATTDDALRVLVGEGLLVPDGDGFGFAHDLLRSAVVDDLLPGERARLHAAHATALTAGARRVVAAEVAHHADRAGDRSRALAWSVRAADEAMRVLAPDQAHRHLERALELWDDVDDAVRVAGAPAGRVALRAARAAGLAGEPVLAAERARDAVARCDDADDLDGGVQARAELVRQLLTVDAVDRAVAPAEDAVRRAGDADPRSAALAHVALARTLLLAHRHEGLDRQAERALAAARAAGDPGLEVEALTTAAFVEEVGGDRAAAAARLGEALRLARDAGELAAELRAHYALASQHYYAGEVAEALPVLDRAMGRVTESGLRWSSPGVELRLLHAVALHVSGDLDRSLAVASAPERPPPDVAAARLGAVACYAVVARGLPDAERRFAALRASWELDPQVGLVAGGCEAERLAWQGEWLAAADAAERAQAHLDTVAGEGMYGGLWLSAMGLAALADQAADCRRRRDAAGEAGAVRRGDVLRERVDRLVTGGHGRPGDLGPEGRAWHARAVAEHARLGGAPAVAEWEAALAGFGYGHLYEEARCHWRLAEALVAAGERAAARSHAAAAADAADRMRAVPLGQAVAATVSRARLTGASGARDAVLTPREREVLALVAEGLTNREIGRRLFISEKTASVHLSNLMTKLDVSSRTEAVTVAHRRGLLDVL